MSEYFELPFSKLASEWQARIDSRYMLEFQTVAEMMMKNQEMMSPLRELLLSSQEMLRLTITPQVMVLL